MKMKALKSFHGDEGPVRRGSEFEAKEGNADAYERQGLAVPLGQKSDSTRKTKADQPAQNKAAEAGAAGGGPRGGATGATTQQSSSRQGQAQKKPRSKK